MTAARIPTAGALAEAAEILGSRARRDYPLGSRTTFRTGGTCDLFVEARAEGDLEAVGRAVAETGVSLLVIGNGSNLLVSDAGFRGLVVCLAGQFESIDVEGGDIVAGAGAGLPVVARRSAAEGLTGFEWAVGVPGTVGGAVVMNAGGHGSQMAAVLAGAWVLDAGSTGAQRTWLAAGDLGLGYRSSGLGPAHVVVAARLLLRPGDRDAAERTIGEIVAWRRANQPGGRNCGSVFANPEGDAAGRLIECSGLKGFRLGTASVSTKHANFFQADPGGSSDDMKRLIEHVADAVEKEEGLRLRPEVRMVGF